MADNEFIDKTEDATKAVNKETAQPKRAPKKAKQKPGMLVQIINGDFLTRSFFLNNLGFIFYIIFLLLLVVGKGYYGKQLSKDVETTQKELDELTADYVEAKTKFEEETRRYKLVMKLGPKGLTESENETKVIRIKKD